MFGGPVRLGKIFFLGDKSLSKHTHTVCASLVMIVEAAVVYLVFPKKPAPSDLTNHRSKIFFEGVGNLGYSVDNEDDKTGDDFHHHHTNRRPPNTDADRTGV